MESDSLTYEQILDVVTRFYNRATRDFLIGYHFRHIQDFDVHLPRIAQFWHFQLQGQFKGEAPIPPFNVFQVHSPLRVKKAEIRRWVIIFKEVLAEFRRQSSSLSPGQSSQLDLWERKLEHFQEKFLTSSVLFP